MTKLNQTGSPLSMNKKNTKDQTQADFLSFPAETSGGKEYAFSDLPKENAEQTSAL